MLRLRGAMLRACSESRRRVNHRRAEAQTAGARRQKSGDQREGRGCRREDSCLSWKSWEQYVDAYKMCPYGWQSRLNARACPAVAICSPAPKQIAVAAKCEHTCKSGKKPVTNPVFKPRFNGCAAVPLARWRTSGSSGELASAVRPSGLGENPYNLEHYKQPTARSIQRDVCHTTT